MIHKQLISRVRVDPRICSGRPYIHGTRIHIAIILDALSQGLAPEEVLEHYPDLEGDDLRAAVAYACMLAEENGGLAVLKTRNAVSKRAVS